MHKRLIIITIISCISIINVSAIGITPDELGRELNDDLKRLQSLVNQYDHHSTSIHDYHGTSSILSDTITATLSESDTDSSDITGHHNNNNGATHVLHGSNGNGGNDNDNDNDIGSGNVDDDPPPPPPPPTATNATQQLQCRDGQLVINNKAVGKYNWSHCWAQAVDLIVAVLEPGTEQTRVCYHITQRPRPHHRSRVGCMYEYE
jgi:hypothetical protein